VLARDVSFICGSRSITWTYLAPAGILSVMILDKLMKRVLREELADPVKGPKWTGILANTINSKLGDMVGARMNYHSNPDSHETLIQLLHRANSVSGALDNLCATDPRYWTIRHSPRLLQIV
jgi:hypothetical protein